MTLTLNDPQRRRPRRALCQVERPPTRQTYDYGANGAGSSQSILIPDADAGTWYLLVYAESVAAPPSSFTLLANATPVVVTAVTPVQYANNAVATLTLTGAGFTSGSSVALVSSDGTTDLSGQQRPFRHVHPAHGERST